MKTLILYMTKHGATQKIAEMIAQRIPDSEVRSLKRGADFSLSGYDCVVLGSPLMAGQVRKEVKEFAQKNSSDLKRMKLGLFVSGMDGKQEAQYFETNFPGELLAHSKSKRFLGGEYDPAKCSFAERFVMKAVAKLSAFTSTIEPGRIDLFVKELTA